MDDAINLLVSCSRLSFIPAIGGVISQLIKTRLKQQCLDLLGRGTPPQPRAHPVSYAFYAFYAFYGGNGELVAPESPGKRVSLAVLAACSLVTSLAFSEIVPSDIG